MRVGLPNAIWREPYEGSQNILYTEDVALARSICRWAAYKDGRIREMGRYYETPRKMASNRHFAVQFRFSRDLSKRTYRAAGLPWEPATRSHKQRIAARRAGKAMGVQKERRQRSKT
ncbi:MAG TPA: hypothetical protein DG761_09885 [Gammaproteobacteria bacterium]|nr:hypothetical protein [Gammaproteobacteria bacterium]